MRRALILISKVVQNVANEVEFGDKEAYMMPMNGFIKEYIPRMKHFLGDISATVQPLGKPPSPLPVHFDGGGGHVHICGVVCACVVCVVCEANVSALPHWPGWDPKYASGSQSMGGRPNALVGQRRVHGQPV
jgi:hypothetical protein